MLPNLIIIGAMKSGTTSLHHYLNLHPEISMSETKELKFFTTQDNWHKGVAWYESCFTGKAKIHGESCGRYTKYPTYDGVPARMHALIPEAKLIYIVRDPVTRIVSHYFHNYCSRLHHKTLSEALTHLETHHYVYCSKYYWQLEQYFPYFSPDQILVIALEKLNTAPSSTLKEVFKFLDVDDAFYSPEYTIALHQSADKKRRSKFRKWLSQVRKGTRLKKLMPSPVLKIYDSLTLTEAQKPKLDQELKQQLIVHLQDDVNRLRAFTGKEFADWCL